ncbi:MAG: tellurite resistance TerB family protein [Bacteroidia bacterium]|nr:tellurite resistance TerB family protein [Bacteroidia bacterium]
MVKRYRKLGQMAPRLSEMAWRAYNNDSKAPSVPSLDELMRRLEFVKMLVSLWSHACFADGKLVVPEEMSVGEMMEQFFGGDRSFFPQHAVDRDAIFGELTETFLDPYPLDEVLDYAAHRPETAQLFFEEACCIVASDNLWHQSEAEFLDAVAAKLGVSPLFRKEVEQKYRKQ